MTRSGNRGLHPYLATLATVAALVSGLWMFPIRADAADAPAAAPTWSTLSPPASPPALAYAAEAFDPANQTVVLFGGVDPSGGLSGNTWIWNGTTWSEAQALSSPGPRELASLAYYPGAGQTQGQLILFGGEGAGGTPLGDTWAWNGQSWVQVATAQASSPAARFGASLAQDATGNLVLFGGTGATPLTQGPIDGASSSSSSVPSTAPAVSAGAGTNQGVGEAGVAGGTAAQATTPSSNTSSPNTSTPNAPSNNGTAPAPGATASSAGGIQAVTTAFVSGDATSTLSDTWVWNGASWSQPDITSAPPARTDAALVWDPLIGQTVLFGGSATPTAGGSASPIGDTWVWSGSAWTNVDATTSPPARFDAASGSAGVVGGDLLVGGQGASGQLSDLWNFTGKTWKPLGATGVLATRSGAAATGNPTASELLVFGGVGAGGNLDDTDILSPAPPLQVVPTKPANGTSSSGSTPPAASGSTSNPSAPGGNGSTPNGTANRANSSSGGPTTAPGATGGGGGSVPATTSVTVGPGTGARITSGGQQPVAGAQTNPVLSSPQGGTPSSFVQTVHTGGLVTMLGSGFKPGAVITITFHSRSYTIGRTVASPEGTFSATVTVPLNASPGHHHLEASGMGPHGRMTILVTPLMVVGSVLHSSQGTPLKTTLIMVGIALALPAGTWVFLGFWGKRRRGPADPVTPSGGEL